MPELDEVWFNKETNEPVLVLFVSGFRLTYQMSGSLKVVSVTEFLESFDKEVVCTS